MLFPNKSLCKERQKIVVSKDFRNSREHRIDNPSQYNIYQYHIDNGIITGNNVQRCDYLVEVDIQPKPVVFFIELKGEKIIDAINQIESTIQYLKNWINKYDIYPRIIISKARTHKIKNNTVIKFENRFPNCEIKEKITDIIKNDGKITTK